MWTAGTPSSGVDLQCKAEQLHVHAMLLGKAHPLVTLASLAKVMHRLSHLPAAITPQKLTDSTEFNSCTSYQFVYWLRTQAFNAAGSLVYNADIHSHLQYF